jgi:hypothetical protein
MTDDLVKRLRAFSEKNVPPLAKAAMMEAADRLSQGEPVAWQYRCHHDDPNTEIWWNWCETTKAHHDDILRWKSPTTIQARALYAAPQPPTVADAMVERFVLAYEDACDHRYDTAAIRFALEAALQPEQSK